MAYIEHLRRLKELLDDGIITEDEFKSLADSPMGNVVPDDYTPYEDDYDPYDDYDPEDAA